MAFKLAYQGIEITCDSGDELKAALSALLEIAGEPQISLPTLVAPPRVDMNGGSRWTADRFAGFIGHLKTRQKRFLRLLVENPDGLTNETLRREFRLKNNNALAGMITALVKNARKVGVGSGEILTKQRVQIGDSTAFEYRVTPALIEVARQHGWPKPTGKTIKEAFATP